jgi:hypothetical protein
MPASDKRAPDGGMLGEGETHRRGKAPGHESDHPRDADIDHGLEETFPASDPVPISPGSD